MGYVVYDEAKAKAAGALDGDQILYVLVVDDLATVYDEHKGEGAWDALSQEERQGKIHTATKHVEGGMEDGWWASALAEALGDEN